MKIVRRDRDLWRMMLPATLSSMEGFFIMSLSEMLRTQSSGLTPKEQVYVQRRLDLLRQATRELRVLSHRLRQSS